jgi:peptidoglycan hydrolase-like protein with peptidoglycan-binding domain
MRTIVGIGISLLLLTAACSKESAVARARAAAEKAKESMPDVEAKALAQKVAPEEVKRAQEALTAVHEYQGEINGELDAVTVNAIEAFQRSRGLRGNGMLTQKTERLLDEVLAARK